METDEIQEHLLVGRADDLLVVIETVLGNEPGTEPGPATAGEKTESQQDGSQGGMETIICTHDTTSQNLIPWEIMKVNRTWVEKGRLICKM